MTPGTLMRNSRSTLARLMAAEHGLAAIEFAIISPFIVLLFLGGVEVSQAIAVKRMVSLTASTVANIVTQYQNISQSSTLPDVLNASSAVLTPYPVANAMVRVSYITIDVNGRATVSWSQALNGTALAAGQVVTLPTALDVPSTSLVFGETTYVYHPTFDFMHIGTFDLSSSVYMFPRSSNGTITLTP
jgi:Flp pilus assembly protein TadG